MNILLTALIMTLIIGCGGNTATKYHENKTPNTINHIIRDAQACNDSSNVWKKLISDYETGRRTIDIFNSITFQSLTTKTEYITLYYKNVTKSLLERPDDAIEIIYHFPKIDYATKDNKTKGFIMQASNGFLNSGYYYVKIGSDCYRGEFPSTIMSPIFITKNKNSLIPK